MTNAGDLRSTVAALTMKSMSIASLMSPVPTLLTPLVSSSGLLLRVPSDMFITVLPGTAPPKFITKNLGVICVSCTSVKTHAFMLRGPGHGIV